MPQYRHSALAHEPWASASDLLIFTGASSVTHCYCITFGQVHLNINIRCNDW